MSHCFLVDICTIKLLESLLTGVSTKKRRRDHHDVNRKVSLLNNVYVCTSRFCRNDESRNTLTILNEVNSIVCYINIRDYLDLVVNSKLIIRYFQTTS